MDGSSIVRDVASLVVYRMATTIFAETVTTTYGFWSFAAQVVLALIGALATYYVAKLRGEQAMLRDEQTERFRKQALQLEAVAGKVETVAVQAEKSHKEEQDGRAEINAKLDRARQIDDGKMRVPMQLVAVLLREKAERSQRPEDFRAAEIAEQALRDHDQIQESLTKMSPESLDDYILSGGTSPTAQTIAAGAVKQAQDIQEYGAAHGGAPPPERP